MHYVGDIHQPLHASTRVNSKYPTGDRGGNSFPLTSKDGINELHAVWDSLLYEFTGYETLVSLTPIFLDWKLKRPFLEFNYLKVYLFNIIEEVFYKIIENYK